MHHSDLMQLLTFTHIVQHVSKFKVLKAALGPRAISVDPVELVVCCATRQALTTLSGIPWPLPWTLNSRIVERCDSANYCVLKIAMDEQVLCCTPVDLV